MAITWGEIYTDSDSIQYKLGYEYTITDNEGDKDKSDVTFTLYIGWNIPSGYYVSDDTNVTTVYWGDNAVDPKTDGEQKDWQGWTEVRRNFIMSQSGTGNWVEMKIVNNDGSAAVAKKTYSKGTSEKTYVLTATMYDVEEMLKYPVVTCSFTIPAIPVLKVNLYSNHATSGTLQGVKIEGLSKNSNIPVYTDIFPRDTEVSTGLSNVQNKDGLYLEREGYTPTHYWGTKENGGTLINEDTGYTGEVLANLLGVDISTSDASVDLYAQWKLLGVKVYANYNGEKKLGTLYARDENGTLKVVKELYQNQNNTFIKIS